MYYFTTKTYSLRKNKKFSGELKIIIEHDSIKGDYKRPKEYSPNEVLKIIDKCLFT